ncbi:hypothetical protein BR93DRAFT_927009 [Coniochaeta sp. PMI_546]|nr:hypothetical protein BR93DRAFT_927009 [Coniochaeta sp. PMI_546]
MSRIPTSQVDSFDFLFDFSYGKTGRRGPCLGYQRPQRCVIPTPVFPHESPLFGHRGPDDSASGPVDPDVPGPSRAELERRSARPYSARVSDQEDFAHVYERTIVPVVVDILQKHCDSDFSIDVHNFPELSTESVPRVIYITLPIAASIQLQELVRDELARMMPPRFRQTHLKFRQGSVKKSTWWGTDDKHIDLVCDAENGSFHPMPTIGLSVGPHCSEEDGGSVGGYLRIGDGLYGLSARHVFQKALDDGDMRVVHPAQGDHRVNQFHDPDSQQLTMGNLFLCSKKDQKTKKDVTRVSLTFEGSGIPENQNQVAMDWCLFGPVPEGKNFLSVPTIAMNRLVTVEKSAMVEGNTEVYALARTSGYSLGYTCDVPGVQMLEGVLRREWTVRQYSPSTWDPSTHLEPPWQCVKRWVTSGIGVPGDSGAWLMRRSDNAVIGLIWARNHNHGTPVERIRLTYITPIVDILADIRERVPDEVALPTYSEAEICYDPDAREVQGALGCGHSAEPWSLLSMQGLRTRRKEEESVIESGIFDGDASSFSPHPLCFPRSTTGQQGSQVYDDTAFASDSSMSVQLSPDRSSPAESIGLPSAGSARRLRDMTLFGMGVVALLQTGGAGSTPPDLEADLSADSIVSSETLDEHDSSVSNDSVMIADQDGPDDNQLAVEGADPIRSKATFAPVGVRPSLVGRPTVIA